MKEMKSIFITILSLLLFLAFDSYSQVIITDDAIADSSAILEMNSDSLGWLIPRMTTAQRDAIQNPAAGLMLYNLDTKSIEYFNNTSWINVMVSTATNLPCGDMLVQYNGLIYGTVEYNGRCWLDRNLGATRVAESVDDPLSYGYYYQWGRGNDGHQLPGSLTTTTLATNPVPGHGKFILSTSTPFDWIVPQNPQLWNDASGYLNNPCPPGWRVPELSEWNMAWIDWKTGENAFQSPLKIPQGGYRYNGIGSFGYIGSRASLWADLPAKTNSFSILLYNTAVSTPMTSYRARGMNVRCIRDEDVFTPISKFYGGIYSDIGNCVQMTPDGSMIIGGYTSSFNAQGWDYLLLKLAQDGSVQWARTYGYYYYDTCFSVIPTSDGGYMLNGTAGWGSTYNDQMYIIKTDATGEVEWDYSCGSNGFESGYDVIQEEDSSFVFVGSTNSFGAGGKDIYFRDFESDGTPISSHAIGTPEDDVGYALIKDTDGGHAIVGDYCCDIHGLGGKDMKFLKIYPDFDSLYGYVYGGANEDGGNDLVLSHDSGYVLAGYTYSYGAGNSDFYIRKLDKYGNNVWSYSYGGAENDIARSIIRTQDNGFAILGQTFSFGWAEDMWLLKINSEGQFEWSFAFGVLHAEYGYSLTQRENGNFIAVGSIWSTEMCIGQMDILLVEFTSDGSACIGRYVDLSGDTYNASGGFQAESIDKEKVIITKVTNDISVQKIKIERIEGKNLIVPESSREVITPIEKSICK